MLIRSGEYPTKKSLLNTNLEFLLNNGTHNSSVAPGYTVDSNTTMVLGRRILEIDKQAFSNADVSGTK